MPDFIIIGTQKGGTTSAAKNLAEHPDVSMARNGKSSELHFFDRDSEYLKGVDYYRSYFRDTGKAQGEKTPAYIRITKAHERMYLTAPNAKLILLLRDPVDRSYSRWNHLRQRENHGNFDWSSSNFDQVLEHDRAALQDSQYIDQIESLLNYFPRKQLYIGVSERIRSNKLAEYNKIFRFIGVPSLSTGTEFREHHVRSYESPMSARSRTILLDHFRPYNKRLFEFLGYDIKEWVS